MVSGGSPTVRQQQLADTLRGYREAAGLTIEEAATRLREQAPKSQKWSRSKVGRIETKSQFVRPAEVEQMLELYRVVSRTERATLIQLARDAKVRGWWQKYPLSGKFQTYVGWEHAATAMRQFEFALVPGLLQTADYARAISQAVEPGMPPETLESHIAARMVRQHALTRPEPLRLQVILDESALRRQVHPPRVMRGQLERLIEAGQQPNISVQVIPFSRGHHVGMVGAFSILTLPEHDGDRGYVEGVQGPVFLEDQHDIGRCNVRWGILSAVALDPGQSVDFLAEVLAEHK